MVKILKKKKKKMIIHLKKVKIKVKN